MSNGIADSRRFRRRFAVLGMVAGMLAFALAVPEARAQATVDPQILTVEDMPIDLTLVVSAAVLRMRGLDDPETIWPVVFSPEAAAELGQSAAAFGRFTLVGSMLQDWSLLSAEPFNLTLDSLLYFADPTGRRAIVSLLVVYGFTELNVEIRRARIETVAPDVPEARLFVVPAADVPDSVLDAGADQLALLEHVVANAVGGERPVPTTPEDYYVFAIMMDRLPADSDIRLRLGNAPDGVAGNDGNAVTVDYHGWRVAVLRGTFALGTGQEFFFKVVHRPGDDGTGGERASTLTAVFSSYGAPSASDSDASMAPVDAAERLPRSP